MLTDNYYVHCEQCPRKCGVNRLEKQTGFCRETDDLRIAFAGLHFGEEPLITVNGGSGTIFFTGCTLRCKFCQNYQISQDGFGKVVTKDDFVVLCEKCGVHVSVIENIFWNFKKASDSVGKTLLADGKINTELCEKIFEEIKSRLNFF